MSPLYYYIAFVFSCVVKHGKIYENRHPSFLIRRTKILDTLLLFDVVWLRTMVYRLSKRVEFALVSHCLNESSVAHHPPKLWGKTVLQCDELEISRLRNEHNWKWVLCTTTERSFLIRRQTRQHMHTSFLIRRTMILDTLLLFNVVWPRTMVYPLSKRVELPFVFHCLNESSVAHHCNLTN
jgi:Na+/serine symporter